MTPEFQADVAKRMREARESSRGYADFFSWSPNRDVEEWSIVKLLSESLAAENHCFFCRLESRGRQNDPPDCEAINLNGERIAIEVTELIDGDAIHQFDKAEEEKRKSPDRAEWSKEKRLEHLQKLSDYAEWPKEKFLDQLQGRLSAKDSRFPKLQGAPYPGGYLVVVHTDEADLNLETVSGYLDGHRFCAIQHITRAFLLLSYAPSVDRCPNFELRLDG